MNKQKLIILTFFGLVTLFLSCSDKKNNKTSDGKSENEKEQTLGTKSEVSMNMQEFVKFLKEGKNLNPFFSEGWALVYHKDDRCEGSTDGQLGNLTSSQIDATIILKVRNDGEGWACEKKDPRSFQLGFDLKQLVSSWDRYEILENPEQEENIYTVAGSGESDYLKLYYNDNNLIIKLEYRSEDPG